MGLEETGLFVMIIASLMLINFVQNNLLKITPQKTRQVPAEYFAKVLIMDVQWSDK